MWCRVLAESTIPCFGSSSRRSSDASLGPRGQEGTLMRQAEHGSLSEVKGGRVVFTTPSIVRFHTE